MFINFGSQGHNTVVGMTRSGKTYAVKKSLERVKEGVLFFNTQLEEMPSNFMRVTANDNINVIKRALKNNYHINYEPTRDADIRGKELSFLVQALYERGTEKKVYFVVDEVHLFEKEPLKKLIEIATTGLRFGINGIWISQRPARIDNTLMTQSNQFVIFNVNMENGYFERYGIPYDAIKEKLNQGGQYSYCIYDFESIEGPFKVNK